jgi:hypothetical protein
MVRCGFSLLAYEPLRYSYGSRSRLFNLNLKADSATFRHGGRLMSWFLAWLLFNVLFGVWRLWIASRPTKDAVSRERWHSPSKACHPHPTAAVESTGGARPRSFAKEENMWTVIVVFLATQTSLTVPGYTSVEKCSAARAEHHSRWPSAISPFTQIACMFNSAEIRTLTVSGQLADYPS